MDIKPEVKYLEAQRKTFISGELHGKFRGELNDASSSVTPDNFYDIEIYQCNIDRIETKKEQEGDFVIPDSIKKYFFPILNPVDCYFETPEGKGHYYKLNILKQKIIAITLSEIMIEGKSCFGKIDAGIFGYIEDTVKHFATGVSETKDEGFKRYERFEYKSHLGFNYWGAWAFKEYLEGLTGNEQSIYLINRRIRRQEYINKKGETHWGKPIILKEENTNFIYWISRIIIASLLLFLFLFLIVNKIWGGLIVLLLVLISLYFSLYSNSRLGVAFKWGARILSLLFFAGILLGLLNIFKTGVKHATKKIKRNDYTHREQSPEETQMSIQNDSIISHYRVWKDYNKDIHSGFLSLYVSDYRSSYNNHLSTERTILKTNSIDFKTLYYNLAQHDNPGMELIVQEFKSLANKYNYNTQTKRFAELIVSCIQDMPYSLIIPTCNSNAISDKEIKQLLIKDCPCKESFPDGVQAPLEFMADLKGDCDTRALFLYALLKRFQFDVVLMVSERYKHAIIGVNLPMIRSNQVYKLFQGQKYYVWETTAPDMPIGALDPTVNNMSLWNVILK